MSIISPVKQSVIFEPLWPVLERFEGFDHLPMPNELNANLLIEGIRFVAQDTRSSEFDDGYEPRIYLRGEVQTRENSWHDFFNALVWQQFPCAKKVINQLQYKFLKQRYPNKLRLPAENMLTLFDENGAIVISHNPVLLQLLKNHRWHELFWERREEVKTQMRVIIFGHGLYEKAINPYIGIIAQALLIEDQNINNLDDFLSVYFQSKADQLSTGNLNPLPILGIPGWWSDNEDESFYANKKYFRERC
ncbi:MAG: DUF3025 domain-containing protein [Gammaproteobacteria bacterium]|nr:DUF3025 domain-containing protein [Gammaproteobacteria bacterium]